MECTECFPHAVRPILAEAVVVGVNICCTDDAHMIGMCDVAHLVRNNKHSLPVVEGCVKRFRVAGRYRCIGILAEVECGSVVLVEVNEYPALPRTVNAVAVTALHVVRDAKIVGVPAAADKRPAVAVHGKNFRRALSTNCHPRTMSYSTQGTTGRGTLVSSCSSSAFAASGPAFDPVDSKDDSPRRAVGRPSGNKGMLARARSPGRFRASPAAPSYAKRR